MTAKMGALFSSVAAPLALVACSSVKRKEMVDDAGRAADQPDGRISCAEPARRVADPPASAREVEPSPDTEDPGVAEMKRPSTRAGIIDFATLFEAKVWQAERQRVARRCASLRAKTTGGGAQALQHGDGAAARRRSGADRRLRNVATKTARCAPTAACSSSTRCASAQAVPLRSRPVPGLSTAPPSSCAGRGCRSRSRPGRP